MANRYAGPSGNPWRQVETATRVPSKKNSYVLRFHPQFWRAISAVVREMKRHIPRLYWVGPSDEVKQFQTELAWRTKAAIPPLKGPVELYVRVWGRSDLDNVLGAILDGLEQGGTLSNDKQVSKLTVVRAGPGKGCQIRLRALESIET